MSGGLDFLTPVNSEPSVPEMLNTLRTMRALNMPYREGGLEDMPALFVKELQLTINVEAEFKRDVEDTLRAQEEYHNAHKAKRPAI